MLFIFERKTFGPGPGHGNYITGTAPLPVQPGKVALLSPAVKTASVFLELLVGGGICLRSSSSSKTFGSQQQVADLNLHHIWLACKLVGLKITKTVQMLDAAEDLDALKGSKTCKVTSEVAFEKTHFAVIHYRCGKAENQRLNAWGISHHCFTYSTRTSSIYSKRRVKTELSVLLTYAGAVPSKRIRIQLHRLHFSDITEDVVVAASVCFHSDAARYFFGAVLASYM